MEKKLSFWIEREDMEKLRLLGRRTDRSMGYWLRKAVKQVLGGQNGR